MNVQAYVTELSGEAYASLLEDSADGVVFATPGGVVLAANSAACTLLGRSQEELRACGRGGFADPADERWAAALQTRARTGRFHGELPLRRGDGSCFPAEVTSVVFDRDGQPQIYAVFRDLTEHHASLDRAAAQERDAALVIQVLESINDAFFSVDADSTITYLNGQAEQLLGCDRGQVVGANLWDAFPTERGSDFFHHAEHVLATGEPVTFQATYSALGALFEVRAYPLPDGGFGACFRDISVEHAATEERERLLVAAQQARAVAERAQADLAHLATHDELTGLLNRSGLQQRVPELARACASSLTVLYIDLDQFKRVNDTLGHRVGDDLLAEVARRLRSLTRTGDAMARLGGDEFLVALVDVSEQEAAAVASRILTAASEPVVIGSSTLRVSASIGLARTPWRPGQDLDLDRLVREADTALYAAKDAGRDRATWFDEALHTRVVHRVRVEEELHRALERGELVLHHQPSFDLGTGSARDVEALVRWNHPQRGLLPPGEFIPVAEDSGLIVALGEWVITQAAAQAAAWADQPDLRVWVNVSPAQLAVPGLAGRITGALQAAAVPVHRFGIEVTESALAERGVLQRELQAVRDAGIAVAVDDFGTGYSSLARLSRMPVDVIKVDRSFVEQAGTPTGDALLEAVIGLAHGLGAHVIAEGVETPLQLERLLALRCDSASGYLLARPGPADRVPREVTDPGLRGVLGGARSGRQDRRGRVPVQRRQTDGGAVVAARPGEHPLLRDHARVTALHRYGVLDSTPDRELSNVVQVAARLFDAPYAAINLLDAGEQFTIAGIGTPTGWGIPSEQSLCSLVVVSGEPLNASDLAADPVLADFPAHRRMGFRFYLGAPITTPDGHTIGSLCVAGPQPRWVPREQAQALVAMAEVVMSLISARLTVVDLLALSEKLARDAQTDPLTGLANRRSVQPLLSRLPAGTSVAVIDLDRFKDLNDAAGHLAGDDALRLLARTLVEHCRRTDLAVRWGGEEFVILFPHTGLGDAQQVVERLRRTWEELGPTTLSAGVAQCREGETALEVIARADAALYEAKAAGRDQVRCA